MGAGTLPSSLTAAPAFTLRPLPPFAFDLSLGSYAGFNPPVPEAVDRYSPGTFQRLLRGAGGALFDTTLTPSAGSSVDVHVWPAPSKPDGCVLKQTVAWMTGAELDLAPFHALIQDGDPVLHSISETLRGLRPPRTPDPFEAFIIAITEQLTSIKTAATLRSRLVARYGERLSLPSEAAPLAMDKPADDIGLAAADQLASGQTSVAYAFPTPEALATASPDDVRAMGFMGGRAACLVRFAQLVADGTLDLASLASLPFDEVLARLRVVKGIGRWTTAYALSRGYGRYDAFPEGDLALRTAVSRLYRGGASATDADVRAILGRYGPYKGLAAFYLIMAYALERYGPHGRAPQRSARPLLLGT